jgi:16S rRNA (uracil1498-N3)-methyltransferase
MSKFFVEPIAIGEKGIVITNRDDIKHIAKVLRLMPGAVIEVSDSAAFEYKARIVSISADEITLSILDKQGFAREPGLRIDLFQGIPKQGKMESIIQKSVELGVHAIIPVFTKRTVVTDTGKFINKIQRWQKISDEAVKQCKRGTIPRVKEPLLFDEMLKQLKGYDLILFLYENEEQKTLKQVLKTLPAKPETMAVIIGPEGGFSDEEASRLRAAGSAVATLGKTILRTETAGAAAIAMIMYELELAG